MLETASMSTPITNPARPQADALLRDIPSVRVAVIGALINLLIYFAGNFIAIGNTSYTEDAPLAMLFVTVVTCLLNFVLVLQYHRRYLWSPLPWFFLVAGLYYGLGPLIYYFGNSATIDYLDAYYVVSRETLLKLAAINSTCVLLVSSVCYWSLALWPRMSYFTPRPMTTAELKKLTFVFLAIGVPVQYLIALPYEFQIIEVAVPGSILACGYFNYLAMFLLVYLMASGRAGRLIKAIGITFIVAELLTRTLCFSKIQVLISLFMIFLGLFPNVKRKGLTALLFFCGSLAIYQVITPFVEWSRYEQIRYGRRQGLSERLDIFFDYIDRGQRELEEGNREIQGSWARFSFANAEAFAVESYDRGDPGDTFMFVVYGLIPRMFWPDKPTATAGDKFNYLVTGMDHTATSPSFIGEAYWNGGWFFTIVTAAYVGFIFSMFTKICVTAMSESDFRFLPLGFFGLFMGLRIEDWFAATYVMLVPISVIYSVFICKVMDIGRDEPT